MIKFISILIFVGISLHATQTNNQCKQDIANITNYYYLGLKKNHEKDYNKAIKYFNISKNHAYSGLDTCNNEVNYDFSVMYDYIINAELQIQIAETK